MIKLCAIFKGPSPGAVIRLIGSAVPDVAVMLTSLYVAPGKPKLTKIIQTPTVNVTEAILPGTVLVINVPLIVNPS